MKLFCVFVSYSFILTLHCLKIKPCIGTNTNNNYIEMCIFFKSKYKKE